MVRIPDDLNGKCSEQEVVEVTTAVVDSPENEQAQAWWFLDTLVVEHRCAPGMDTVVLEMTLPAGSSPPLHVHDDLDDTWYILDGQMVVRWRRRAGRRCRALGLNAPRRAAHVPSGR